MFSVLTLNLRFGLANDGAHSWSIRKKVYPSLLNRHRSDFISFQEANDFQIDFLQTILSDYHYIGKRHPAPKFWQNNVIFYQRKWKCSYYNHFFLSPTPLVPSRFRKSRWPRQCTIGMFKNGKHRLICANTHFDFDPDVQVKSAELILERLSDLPPNLPAILMGDFNADPSWPCYGTFTSGANRPNQRWEAFENAFSKPFPGTHHGFTGDPSGGYIDWILYRGKVARESSNIILDSSEGIYPSDHFPLRATFRWKDENG